MKGFLGVVSLALVTLTGVASAQGATEEVAVHHEQGALGFHSIQAPLGGRWWLNHKFAIDLGLGFGSTEDAGDNTSLSNWALDFGVPIRMRSYDRLHVIFRPGILYQSQEVVTDPGPPILKDDATQMALNLEIEAEVFLTDHFSVSASQGLAFITNSPPVGDSTNDWGTTGANFTTLGFHVYMFGSKE
jgi:hypothetical protein